MESKVFERLKKKFDNPYLILDKDNEEELEVISTGSLSLDVSTGIGGIPKRRVTTIYGAESSGKTTLCLEIVKQAIKGGDNVAYIDVEQGLDYRYVETLVGDVDISKLLIAQPETSEEALSLVEVFIQGDEKLGIAPGEYKLIIIDSVAALAPEAEKEKELTDKQYALTASTLTKFFRRNVFDLRKNDVALIFVNQVRANIGGYGGYTIPGGYALKHYSSMIIFLSPSQKIKQGEDIIGIQCKFTVKKNKLSTPFRSFYFPLMFGHGIDYYRDMVEFAAEMGIIKKRAAYYYYGETMLGQGMVKSMEFLEEHEDVRAELVTKCLSTVGKVKEEELEIVEEELDIVEEV